MTNHYPKPCPFCAEKNVSLEKGRENKVHLECENCGARGPLCASWEHAVEVWNTRPAFALSITVTNFGKRIGKTKLVADLLEAIDTLKSS